ncbi:MAG: hypothetical protein V2B13_16520, partial [Pseudomonadota bacterium]
MTKDEPDILKKAQILVDYIHQNVFMVALELEDKSELDNLIRGVGVCDQVSKIFIRLTEPLDLRGYLVSFNAKRDGTGISPHSIAVITPKTISSQDYSNLIKEGIVVDVLQGVIFKNKSGKGANFADLSSKNVLNSQRQYFPKPVNYRRYGNKAKIDLINIPISQDRPETRFFFQYIFPILPEKILYFYQDMILKRLFDGNSKSEIDFLYYKARNYHIYGRFNDAIPLYEMIIQKSHDRIRLSACLFFEGMIYYRQKKYDKAQEKLEVAGYGGHYVTVWAELARDWLKQIEIDR